MVAGAGFGIHFTTETPYDETVAAWDNEVGVNLRGRLRSGQGGAARADPWA